MANKSKGDVAKYWGFLTFGVLVAGVFGWIPGVAPAVLLGLSVVTGFFFVFRMPVWCGAVNRNGTYCRENAYGLLLGCHRRQHKWQKLKMRVARSKWAQANRGLWTQPRDCIATLGGFATVASGVTAIIALIK